MGYLDNFHIQDNGVLPRCLEPFTRARWGPFIKARWGHLPGTDGAYLTATDGAHLPGRDGAYLPETDEAHFLIEFPGQAAAYP